MPLRALITPENRYDGPFLPKLIQDLEAVYVLADAAYCSEGNFRAVRAINAIPVIADNPWRGRKIKACELLRFNRYVVGQFNGLIKDDVLDGCWLWSRGLVKKSSMVLAGLICLDVNVIDMFVEGEESLRKISK